MRTFIKNSALAIAAMATLAACGSKGPEAVATEYFKALSSADLAKAKSFGNSTTSEYIDLSITAMGTLEQAKPILNDLGKEFKTCKCNTTGDKSVCAILDAKQQQVGDNIVLIKKDGKWIVDATEQVNMLKEMKRASEEMEAAAAAAEAAANESAEEAVEEVEETEE